MKDAVLITGTDTGVGKTVVAAGLVQALRFRGFSAAPMKPFATGCRAEGRELVCQDAQVLAESCQHELPLDLISPVRYLQPLAPAVAARAEGRPVDVEAAFAAFSKIVRLYDFVVVEGIGGLAVPLTDDMTVADFALRARLDVVVVARRTLGTLNHTKLTVEYALSKGLAVRGIVLCGACPPEEDLSAMTNASEIERLVQRPVLSAVPALEPGTPIHEVIEAAAAHLATERIMNL